MLSVAEDVNFTRYYWVRNSKKQLHANTFEVSLIPKVCFHNSFIHVLRTIHKFQPNLFMAITEGRNVYIVLLHYRKDLWRQTRMLELESIQFPATLDFTMISAYGRVQH
jgi:hypothetical protein